MIGDRLPGGYVSLSAAEYGIRIHQRLESRLILPISSMAVGCTLMTSRKPEEDTSLVSKRND
jgi:hypothetical protein